MTGKGSAARGVAVLGCGDMGRAHAAAWQEREDSRVVAVFDPDRERAEAMAAGTGAEVCESWQAAIEKPGVQAVSICTPICFHAGMAGHAAKHGRHVLTEKAIALTLEDADSMIAAAAAAGVKLVVAYQHRTFPQHRTWRSLVQRGILEGPLHVRFEDIRSIRPKPAMHRRSMNGGPVIDMAGHHFDLLRYFTGGEPLRVTAHGHCFGASKPELRNIEDPAVDAAEILVEYTGGHVLSTYINWGLPAGYPGSFSASVRTAEVVSVPVKDGIAVRRGENEELCETVPGLTGTAGRVEDLVSAIEADARPEVAGEDGRKALEVCLAALESIATGKTVELA